MTRGPDDGGLARRRGPRRLSTANLFVCPQVRESGQARPKDEHTFQASYALGFKNPKSSNTLHWETDGTGIASIQDLGCRRYVNAFQMGRLQISDWMMTDNDKSGLLRPGPARGTKSIPWWP